MWTIQADFELFVKIIANILIDSKIRHERHQFDHLRFDEVSFTINILLNCSLMNLTPFRFQKGYENFMGSEGIHVDFTPPDPGHRIEVANDTLQYEDCVDYTPEHLQHLCSEQTSLPNYRFENTL